jgi:hypothetical protein
LIFGTDGVVPAITVLMFHVLDRMLLAIEFAAAVRPG